MPLNFYEDLGRSRKPRAPSDRNFGLVFTAFFAVLGFWPVPVGGHVRVPLVWAAGVFLAAAFLWPSWLHPLNRAWTLLGSLLGRIVNPIVTAVLFFLVFVPAGLASRFAGKDPLRLKPAPEADTYWIVRHPPGPQPDTMSKQF